MATEKQWYLNKSGQIEGPFTSSQLRELAISRILEPQALVRLGTSGPWSHAYVVKGLFPEGAENPKDDSTPAKSKKTSKIKAASQKTVPESDASNASELGKTSGKDDAPTPDAPVFDTPIDDLSPKPLSVSSSDDFESLYAEPNSVLPPTVPESARSKTADLPAWLKNVPSASPGAPLLAAASTGNPEYPLSSPPLPSDAILGSEVSPQMSRPDESDGLKRLRDSGAAPLPPDAFQDSGSIAYSSAERQNEGNLNLSESMLPVSDTNVSNSSVDQMFGAISSRFAAHIRDPREEGGKELPGDLQILLKKNEQVLYADNPSAIILIVECFVGLLSWILFGFLPGVSFIVTGEGVQAFIWMFSCAFLFGVLVLVLYLRWLHQFYVITDQRTIVRGGIFRVSICILFNSQIKSVFIFSTFASRFLGLYAIHLSASDIVPQGVGTLFASSGVLFHGVKINKIIQIYNSILNN